MFRWRNSQAFVYWRFSSSTRTSMELVNFIQLISMWAFAVSGKHWWSLERSPGTSAVHFPEKFNMLPENCSPPLLNSLEIGHFPLLDSPLTLPHETAPISGSLSDINRTSTSNPRPIDTFCLIRLRNKQKQSLPARWYTDRLCYLESERRGPSSYFWADKQVSIASKFLVLVRLYR